MSKPRPRGRSLLSPTPVWLGLILLLAGALRVRGIGDGGFWLDEFCSVECSTGRGLAHVALPRNVLIADPPPLTTLAGAKPWWEIWTSMRLDNHPPLYFILLRWQRDAFGESDISARALSAAASMLAILFFFDAVRVGFADEARVRWTDARSPATWTALWASLLMAVAMPQVHFAQEARQYALLLMFGMFAMSAFVRIESFGGSAPRVAALAFGILAMLLTHYYAIAPIAALAIYALARLRGRPQRRALVAGAAAIGVYAIAWGPFLWQQRNNVGVNNAWQIEPAQGHAMLTILRVAAMPLRFLIEEAPSGGSSGWLAALAGAAIVGVTMVALTSGRFGLRSATRGAGEREGATALTPRADRNTFAVAGMASRRPFSFAIFAGRRSRLLLWYFWLFLPLLLVAIVDLAHGSGQSAVVRYTLIASPALYAMLAAAGARYRVVSGVLMATIVCVCVALSPMAVSTDRAWPLLAETLRSHVRAGDAIVYASASRDDWYAGALYLGVSHYAGKLPAPIVLLTAPAPDDLRQRLSTFKTIWLLAGDDDAGAPKKLLGVTANDHATFSYAGTLWEIEADRK